MTPLDFVRSLDSKLVSTLLSTALARGALALGGDPVGDPLWNGLISLAVGAVIGWLWPNDGSVLRAEQESGNPDEQLVSGHVDADGERGQSVIELVIGVLLILILVAVLMRLL